MDHNLLELNDDLWEFCAWAIDDLRERFARLAVEVAQELTPALRKKWREDTGGYIRSQFARLPDEVEPLLEKYEPAGEAICGMLHQALAEKGAVLNPTVNFQRASASLRDFFGLDETAVEVCTLSFLKDSYAPINKYLRNSLDLFKLSGCLFWRR